MKKIFALFTLILTLIMVTNMSAMAYTKAEKIAVAQVQATKAVKARLGANAKIRWRYVKGEPDCWIEGNSYVIYGTANGMNFSCDVIIDEAKDKVYVKQLSF